MGEAMGGFYPKAVPAGNSRFQWNSVSSEGEREWPTDSSAGGRFQEDLPLAKSLPGRLRTPQT